MCFVLAFLCSVIFFNSLCVAFAMKIVLRGQGSMEYLLLAAAAIILAIIVITALAAYLNQGNASGNIRFANSQCAVFGLTDCPAKFVCVAAVRYNCVWDAASTACVAQSSTPIVSC